MGYRTIDDQNFLFSSCFSDKYSFFKIDIIAVIFYETHTQPLEERNVWTATFRGHLVGSFFSPANLNGEVYLQVLEQTVNAITEKSSDTLKIL